MSPGTEVEVGTISFLLFKSFITLGLGLCLNSALTESFRSHPMWLIVIFSPNIPTATGFHWFRSDFMMIRFEQNRN